MNNTVSMESGSTTLFLWEKNLETGIVIIDQQHQQLVSLVNLLANSLVGCDTAESNGIFAELTIYAGYHFTTEHQIWQQTLGDDPWVALHDAEHDQFLPAIERIRTNKGQDASTPVMERVFRFLVRWLLYHILEDDKKMAFVVLAVQQGMAINHAKALANSRSSNSFTVLIDTLLNMHDQLTSNTVSLMRERQERIATQRQLELSNQRLRSLSITDQLTKLHNRRHFDDTLRTELRRSCRQTQPLALIYLDIDDFKRLNDHYGHARGDLALQQVASQIKQQCQRAADFAFRIGGEEFAILLTHTAQEQAEMFAEKLRLAVIEQNIPNESSRICPVLTLSLGIYCKVPGVHDTCDVFRQGADTALYAAKQHGRNCWISHDGRSSA